MPSKISSHRDFFTAFFATLGTISSIVTLISFVYQLQCPSLCLVVGYSLGVIFLSLLTAYLLTYQKNRLTIKISNTLTVKIEQGDLFEKGISKNVIVIPVNEYFDTIVDDKIISASSIHGQFINKFYEYNHGELHEEIQNYLDKHSEIKCKETPRPNTKKGYTRQYPLGTCVPVHRGQVTYVLMAFTHFDQDDHAFVELSELGHCISCLCKFLSSNADNNPVFMPLMGMGLSRLNQPAQFILKYTLDTIVGIKGLSIPGDLNIIVYPPMMRTLNLNEIQY